MEKVLLVDDESTVRTTLAAYLEDEGLEVVPAESAEDALRIVERDGPFGVCIMDMRLPGMDGHDAIIALHMRLPQLCFLIHTGSLSYGLTDDLLALGITEERLFRKPLQDMAALAATVRSLLGGGQ
ncbi:MAG TPA: response regulator [Candidatus Hydrogenedentes bacterium]|jgi:CheY-like chemotaxis protein|nr:response regulator [Candidatus Hydrogenedentota bacterium]HQM99769.1 response regulator [Candidatus Hydrogenedentota bacterium]